MGGRKEESNQLAQAAYDEMNSPEAIAKLQGLQDTYDSDLNDLKSFDIQNFYKDLSASTINMTDPETGEFTGDFAKGQRTGEKFVGDAAQAKKQTLAAAKGYGDNVDTFEAFQTDPNIQGLARRGSAGLSNTMNNLQVSTAGAEMAAQEADQSLAASQDLAAQAGTGAGGATALAAAAAKSKQGISADIDRQVKSNEQLRAQGEQGLQRDMLAQGNLASQFNLGQSQFNVGAQNQASQFGASARNQAAQFGAGASNQFALSRFSAENQMNQFNTSQSNAERMAEFGALQNANALNASAVNSAISQNASNQNSFDMGRAGGQAQADAARYGQNVDIAGISANALNNEQERSDQDDQIIAQGQSASNKRDKWQKFWGSGKYNSKYDPNHKRYQGKAYDDSNDYKG